MATIETSAPPIATNASDPARGRLLIEAANDLLDESGLEGLTIRAVLARSGLARRAFYERFNGKDDLVLAVFEETLRAAAEHFRSEARSAENPVDALRRIVTGIVLGQLGIGGSGPGRRGAALSREHLRLAESRPHDLQSALKPLLDLMAEQVEAGVAQGMLRPCDPRWQAGLIYNLVSATTHVELLAEEEGAEPNLERRAEQAETIWEFCRRAVIL